MTAFPRAAKTTDARLREIADTTTLSQVINEAVRPALVLFDTVWCSPARRIEERLLRLFRGGCVDLVRVNVDRLPELAKKFALPPVPTPAPFPPRQLPAPRLADGGERELRPFLPPQIL